MDDTLPAGWMTADRAVDYTTGSYRTSRGHRKLSERFLAREVAAGRLRAARVGGRGQLLFKREWLDRWLEEQSTPTVVVPTRRRA